jgi:hypothetical protein
MKKIKGCISLLLFCLTSCTYRPLVVQTEYISHENLASYQVGTPDPRLNEPMIGQRLILTWSIPKSYLDYEDLHIHLKVRFHSREEEELEIPVHSHYGTYVYSLVDEKFCASRGILTYKAEMIANHCILEEWRHQLWSELISFDIPEE